MACVTHAATNMGNVSGRHSPTQAYRMDLLKQLGNFDAATFTAAYPRLLCSMRTDRKASGCATLPASFSRALARIVQFKAPS